MKLKHILNRLLLEDTLRQHLEKFPFFIDAIEDMGEIGEDSLDAEVEFDTSGIIPDIYVKLQDDPLIPLVREKVYDDLLESIREACYASPMFKYIVADIQNNEGIVHTFIDNALKKNGKDLTKYKFDKYDHNIIYYFSFLFGKNMPVIPRQFVGSNKTPVLVNAILTHLKSYSSSNEVDNSLDMSTIVNVILDNIVLSSQTTTFVKFTEGYVKMLDELVAELRMVVKSLREKMETQQDVNRREIDDEIRRIMIATTYVRILHYDAKKPLEETKAIKGLKEDMIRFEQNKPPKESDYYLKISSAPEDKMRISISRFWSSCQNAYTGSQRHQLPVTVHDKNTKVAYVLIDRPFTDNKGNRHDQSPLMRVLIRFNPDTGEFGFDGIYPNDMDRNMTNMFKNLIETHIGKQASNDYKSHPQNVPIKIRSTHSYSDKFRVHNTVRDVIKKAFTKYPFLSQTTRYIPEMAYDGQIENLRQASPISSEVLGAWQIDISHDDYAGRTTYTVLHMPGGVDWLSDINAVNLRAKHALGCEDNSNIMLDSWFLERYLLNFNFNDNEITNIVNNNIFTASEREYLKKLMKTLKVMYDLKHMWQLTMDSQTSPRHLRDAMTKFTNNPVEYHVNKIMSALNRVSSNTHIDKDFAREIDINKKYAGALITSLYELLNDNGWFSSPEIITKTIIAFTAASILSSVNTSGISEPYDGYIPSQSSVIGEPFSVDSFYIIPFDSEYIFGKELADW
jgi:hypothetical protein